MLSCCQIGGLQVHVGCEAFVLIIKNNTESPFEPAMFWTSKELEDFMSVITHAKHWDTLAVTAKLEAYAVALCDVSCIFLFSDIFYHYLTQHRVLQERWQLCQIPEGGSPDADQQQLKYVISIP
jgi:hypothetical protein